MYFVHNSKNKKHNQVVLNYFSIPTLVYFASFNTLKIMKIYLIIKLLTVLSMNHGF